MAFQARPASPVGVQPDSGMGRDMHDDACTWHQDMPLESWEEWKVEAKKRFIGYEPNPFHLLNQVKISQFTTMQAFIVKFQECANKVLAQLTRGYEVPVLQSPSVSWIVARDQLEGVVIL
ncbi:hypothetical protein DSO57_1006297 [Entomophthora muscae]|uniref:Uncharacterized protein n=1 Tax=Entomophthora muscae TaxID=34485 RepID=A0ACC2SKQ6_9FUNG|nr:hypothetical protein DSO57_1006297 [Entomophthora muscae]